MLNSYITVEITPRVQLLVLKTIRDLCRSVANQNSIESTADGDKFWLGLEAYPLYKCK